MDIATILNIVIPVATTAIGYLLRHWNINVPLLPVPSPSPVGPAPKPADKGPLGLFTGPERDALLAAALEKARQVLTKSAPAPGLTDHPILDELAKLLAARSAAPAVPAPAQAA